MIAHSSRNDRPQFKVESQKDDDSTRPTTLRIYVWKGREVTWRIIPVSKWLVTPMYKPFRPFGRGLTTRSLGVLLTIVINHLLSGMSLQVTWTEAWWFANRFFESGHLHTTKRTIHQINEYACTYININIYIYKYLCKVDIWRIFVFYFVCTYIFMFTCKFMIYTYASQALQPSSIR